MKGILLPTLLGLLPVLSRGQVGSLLNAAQASGYILLRDRMTGQEAVMPRLCTFYPDSGKCFYVPDGYKMVIRYFYNTTSDQCTPFWYTQCAGNQNRFLSVQHCHNYCSPKYVNPPQSNGPQRNVDGPGGSRVPGASNIDSAIIGSNNNLRPRFPPQDDFPTPSPDLPPPNVCELPKDGGIGCARGGKRGEQRWYWDEGRFNCFAFRFQGCGGTLNNFLTQDECVERCRPLDGPVCSLGGVPANVDFGNQAPRSCRTATCPAGYECKMGAFFPSCCPLEFEREEECADGSAPYSPPQAYYWMADSCEDLQCPDSFTCIFVHDPEIRSPCCLQARWGGKRPNEKRASEAEPTKETWKVIRPSPLSIATECLAFKEPGPCKAAIPRWYMDFNTLECRNFVFGGCGGNANNFETKEDCEKKCRGQVPFN